MDTPAHHGFLGYLQRHPLQALALVYLVTTSVIFLIEGVFPGLFTPDTADCKAFCGDIVNSVLLVLLLWPVTALLDIISGLFSNPLFALQGMLYLTIAALFYRWWWRSIWKAES